jgi:hypothetical protein
MEELSIVDVLRRCHWSIMPPIFENRAIWPMAGGWEVAPTPRATPRPRLTMGGCDLRHPPPM